MGTNSENKWDIRYEGKDVDGGGNRSGLSAKELVLLSQLYEVILLGAGLIILSYHIPSRVSQTSLLKILCFSVCWMVLFILWGILPLLTLPKELIYSVNGMSKRAFVAYSGISFVFFTGILLEAVYERDINEMVDTLYFVSGLLMGIIGRYSFLSFCKNRHE